MGRGNRPILTETSAVPAKAQAVRCRNRVPEEEAAQSLHADLLWAPPNTVFSCWAFTWGKTSSTGQRKKKRVMVSGHLRVILCPWRTRAPLPADSHCLWGSGGNECSVHNLPLPGIRCEEEPEDGAFWVPLDTCPLYVSWGGSVDPGKGTNVSVCCQVSRAPDLSPDWNWNLLSLILLIWGWEGAGVAMGVKQCMSLNLSDLPLSLLIERALFICFDTSAFSVLS